MAQHQVDLDEDGNCKHGVYSERGDECKDCLIEWVVGQPHQIRITTAPDRYDGFGTQTIEVLEDKPPRIRTYRKVAILDEHYTWQTGRYSSGMHPTITLDQFAELDAASLT